MSRYSIEAEKAVIGSILIDKSCIPIVSAVISPDDMYFELHKAIIKTAFGMHLAGDPVDPITVWTKVKESGTTLDASYVLEIVDMTPTSANAKEYAEIVKADSIRRQLIDLGTYLCESDEPSPLLTLAEANKRIEGIGAMVTMSCSTSFDACQRFMEYRANIDKQKDSVFVKTGISKLDAVIGGGLLKSGLYVIAGRPGMGKSISGIVIADNVASRGEPVLFISREMSEAQIMARRIARLSCVQSNIVLMGALSPTEYQNVTRATAELSQHALRIEDKKGKTIQEIGAIASGVKGLRLLVIDYFGLLRHIKPSGNRITDMREVSNAAKQLAKDLDVPILMLAQLNRDNEKRGNHRPSLSDLRETGALEEDADGVIFLHSEDYYAENRGELLAWQLEMIVAKNRHGGVGTAKMALYPATSKITN